MKWVLFVAKNICRENIWGGYVCIYTDIHAGVGGEIIFMLCLDFETSLK